MKKPLVNIVAIKDNWILHEFAERLNNGLSYAHWTEKPTGQAKLTYYINYAQVPAEPVPGMESAMFTHIEEGSPELVKKWWDTANRVDVAVFMSKMYAKRSKKAKAPGIVISPGVDMERFQQKPIKIGMAGSVKKSGRKGEALIKKMMDIPGLEWHFAGSGWPGQSHYLAKKEVPAFMANLDYLLITSRIEGGPMPAIEALASGVPIISTEVGWVPDLPHISFKFDDEAGLRKILESLVAERSRLRNSVANMTWDNYVVRHDRLFKALLDMPGGPPSRRQVRRIVAKLKR